MKKITVLLMSILLLLSACGQAPIVAETETIPQVTQEQKEAPMIPAKAEAVDESTEAGDNAIAAKPAEQMDAPKGADKAVEKQPASAEAGRPAVSEAPAASKSEAKSDPAPTLTPAPKPEPAPTPEPTPMPTASAEATALQESVPTVIEMEPMPEETTSKGLGSLRIGDMEIPYLWLMIGGAAVVAVKLHSP